MASKKNGKKGRVVEKTGDKQNQTLSWRVTATLLTALIAAWLAAGSLGLFAHPLRRIAVLILLVVCVLLQEKSNYRWWTWILMPVGAAWMLAQPQASVNVGAVVWVLSVLALSCQPMVSGFYQIIVTALAAFMVTRMAVTGIPWLWLVYDRLGAGLMTLAGSLCGQSLTTGATFAGLDILVLAVYVWGAGLYYNTYARRGRLGYGLAGIVLMQTLYGILLACLPSIQDRLLLENMEPATGLLTWWERWVPWNVPILAALGQLGVLGMMLRWSSWAEAHAKDWPWPAALSRGNRRLLRLILPILALVMPVLTSLYPSPSEMTDKKIVFYEKGFLNWLKPEHGSYGRLSSGMYGMLPVFTESLGARAQISPDLSADDLGDADVVVLLFPDDPWLPGQRERIWEFVKQGGTLLVMGEHTTQDPNGSNRFNEILEPTAMRVNFDSATFAVGGWLHSYEALSHPATLGITDLSNDFGVVIGASLDIELPARPLLVGRWGWSDWGDPGSSRAMMGDDRWRGDEKLGDLLLAAEQPLGQGRVVAFGDTSGLTNGINVGAHIFNAQLWNYLAAGAPASTVLRQNAAIILVLGLLVSLLLVQDHRIVQWSVLGLALSCVIAGQVTQHRHLVLPDGRSRTPSHLAYIDNSHVASHSSESWRPDGVGGLILTLMRNGFLTLQLPEISQARLERAGFLFCNAPAREYNTQERAILQDYVEGGGILMITVGNVRVDPVRSLLADFGFRILSSRDHQPEPRALGHFKSPYLRSENDRVFVRFHAAWSVASDEADAEVLAYGTDNLPVIMMRRFGTGKVVVVADTDFATNKNLEREDGRPFEGMRENADFWRWLLTILRDQPMWVPEAVRTIDN